MSYQLGIDLGTTYTAAAICRGTERAPSGADVVTLGARSATVASVMYLADDGSVLVGEAAERRSLTDPDRVVREFKRRIGDEIPLMIGGRQYQAHELGARMTRWVVDLVSEREGGPPRRIAVTHPASWGAYKKDLLGRALRDVGLGVTFLAEPQAAAVSYASAERVDPGSTVAVYDLGGGTFDAAVVRKTPNGGFELLGQPEGIERLGGIDFDEAVFAHVRDSLSGRLDELDPEDPDVLAAVARLRRECVEAKEALSSDTEATIPVLLPNLRTQVRLVRAEFEVMIRPALEDTIVALRRAVSSAGLRPEDLTAVLLVGGSSRIPLVSQLVSDELGRPVAVDADPKTAIAMGAALAISPQPQAQPQAQALRQAPPPAGARMGGRPPAAGVSGSGGHAAVGGAYLNRPPGVPPPGGGVSGPGMRGPGGGVGGPGGSAPPRPPVGSPMAAEPPPRPEAGVEPAAFVQQGRRGGSEDGYYAEPARRRPNGAMIGIGGMLAIAAILAAVFLWPSSSDSSSTGSSSDLTPATSAVPTTQKHSSSGSGGSTHANRTTPKATPHPTPTPSTRPSPTPSEETTPTDTPESSEPTHSSTPSTRGTPSKSAAHGGTNQGAQRSESADANPFSMPGVNQSTPTAGSTPVNTFGQPYGSTAPTFTGGTAPANPSVQPQQADSYLSPGNGAGVFRQPLPHENSVSRA